MKTQVILFSFSYFSPELLILVYSVYIPKKEIYLWVFLETWEVINLKHVGDSFALLHRLDVPHGCSTQWTKERKTM